MDANIERFMPAPRKLIVVCGPTASGKSDVGARLASRLGSAVVSADSRQIFRGMAIGTAQPDAIQSAAAPHYLVDCRDVRESFTAGDFEREALALLDELFAKHPAVVLVGGSGLYIDALCRGLDPLPAADHALRAELEAQWRGGGAEILLARLAELDPSYYTTVDRANPNRVIRALEVCLSSGRPYSELRRGGGKPRDFDILKIGLRWPREELYARVDARVDAMMAAGLEAEARGLYPLRGLNALQTVGYRELFDHFDGKQSLARAVELIKQNSRRYAKRQITWFSRDADIHWFHPREMGDIDALVSHFTDGGIIGHAGGKGLPPGGEEKLPITPVNGIVRAAPRGGLYPPPARYRAGRGLTHRRRPVRHTTIIYIG